MAITINLSILGDGIYTIEDDGTPGNNTSIVRDPLGNIVTTFAHPADSLTIISRPGQSLNINITDSLTTANFTVGNIDNAFANQRPDNIQIGGVLTSGTVILTANQTVREWGNDAATDIIAGALLVRAGTGIGSTGNFIETQVSAMEAESNTGGIAFSNINDVVLHVATPAGDLLRGLWTGTSGNVTLINQGSILLADNNGIESARSAGNLQLTAIGATADISSNVNRDALLAVGNINLSAGRDVLFGTVGADFDNDVRAGGSITITAGRDFHIDGFSDLASDDQGLASNGGVSITAGRDILIEDDNGVDASVGVTATASTGAVVLTTGVGGTLSLAANSSAAVQGRNGGVIVNADRVLIENDSGINVSGTGTLRITGASAGRLINIGSATDGVTALELSDAELDRLSAQNVIIGSANAGQATVVGAVTHTNQNLTIESGADILVEADITTPGSVTLRSGEDVFLNAGSTITTGTLNVFVDTPDLDGPGGANIFDGAMAVTTLNLSGSADADTLRGINDINQIVHGNGGGDTIVSSGEGQYFGDEGDDTIFAGPSSAVINELLDGGLGIDTLDTTHYSGSYVINLETGVTNFAFESFVNFENVITGGGGDTIVGNAANNIITAGDGNDSLTGAGGSDTLNGGIGDDFFFVESGADVVNEAVGEGNDRVFAGASYTLAAGASIEMLTTTSNAGTAAINLTGNEIVQSIVGNAGVNTLDSGGGGDTMMALGGDDFYIVRAAGDRAVESAGAGNDTVMAAVSFILEAGSAVESLRTVNQAAVTAINLTGNALTQTIVGNAGANTLDSGGGGDTMIGLGGDDFYFVRVGADRAVEAAGTGTDRVFAAVSFVLEAGSSIETLSTTNNAGVTAINLTGNALTQTIFGNAGANSLDSGGGGDTMLGFGGDDFYFIRAAGDRAVEAAASGSDRVFAAVSFTLEAGSAVEIVSTILNAGVDAINLNGNELAQSVLGNAGANVIDGKGASDTLSGLGGADTFSFTTALGAGNVDQITDFQGGIDKIQLENAIFTGLAGGALPANAFVIGSAAADADDRIIYNNVSGALLFDVDGVGGVAAVQFAALQGAPALAATDFVVV